jgi:RNA polymerase sigma-70 factor (ECF subfamily)
MYRVNALAEAWPRKAAAARRPFADVARDHLDDVYRYLVFLTADPVLAEDLTAETFEKAFRSWKRFDPRRGGQKTWLCQLARSRALDYFRAETRRRRREKEAYDELRVAEPLGGELSHELDSALRSLSAAEREVVVLRVVLELSAAEAARILRIGRTACSMRLARALQKLEERMNCDVVA